MPALLDDSLVIVLAGGAGERLYPLTKDRAKPAVYFGGPYRIIDFALSNCINSGLRRIFIATQYKSLSLNRHIRMGWGIVSEELGEFVEILPPQKRVSEHWYQGTADAVYQNLYSIIGENPRYLIVLSGDHVYKMDYARMLRSHQERGAAVTLATIEVPIAEAQPLRHHCDRRTRARHRLPGKAAAAAADSRVQPTSRWRRWASTSSTPTCSCATLEADASTADHARLRQGHHPGAHSRGAGVLLPLLRREQEGVEVLARHRHARRVLRSQHGSLPGEPRIQPVRSRVAAAHLPAAGAAREVRLRGGRAALRTGARFGHLSRLHRLRQHHPRQRALPERARAQLLAIEQCILMPGVRVGRHARIRRAIIDRDVLIPRGALIGYNPEEDRRRHTVTDSGVVVVTPEDEPLIGPLTEEALTFEAEADRRGSGG